jgi:hypothetical protein
MTEIKDDQNEVTNCGEQFPQKSLTGEMAVLKDEVTSFDPEMVRCPNLKVNFDGRTPAATIVNERQTVVAGRELYETEPMALQVGVQSPHKKEFKTSKVKAIKALEEQVQSVELMGDELYKTGSGKRLARVTPQPAVVESERVPERNKQSDNSVSTEWSTGANSIRVTGDTSVQLPLAAVKVRNVDGKVVNLVAEIIPHKVIVQGVVHEQLFFVGTDSVIHHLAAEVPFNTFIDLPGVQPGMNAYVTAVVEKILTELAPDGLSIIMKIIIAIFLKITKTVQIGLLPGNGPLLLLDQVVGDSTTQSVLENDLILASPALEINEVVGMIRDLTTEVTNDKVIIQGILHKQIFLVDADHQGGHQAEDLPFSVFIDLPGAVPGMTAQVRMRLQGLFYELVSATVLRQKAVLDVSVKVTETVRKKVTLGEGPLFKVIAWVNENTVRNLRETVIVLPITAAKICELNTQIREITTQVVVNKAIVQGFIHQQILFIDTDNVERHQAERFPFVIFLDLPGVTPDDQVQITANVERLFFHLEGPTQLQQKMIIAVTGVVNREMQLNLVLNAGPLVVLEQVVGEGTKQVLVVRQEVINPPPPPPPPVPTIVSEVIIVDPGSMLETGRQIVLRNQAALPVQALSVKEVNGTIVDPQYWVNATGVIVAGAVIKDVVFVDLDHVVRRINERIPFIIMVTVPGIDPDQPVEVSVLIENITFELEPAGTKINQTLVLQATVAERTPTTTATVVTDVSGPGVIQTKITVNEWVLLPDGRSERREFGVVTTVTGQAIAGVERAVIVLNVIENGTVNRRPVEVVTRVIINEM